MIGANELNYTDYTLEAPDSDCGDTITATVLYQ